jgi:hypothetical protein
VVFQEIKGKFGVKVVKEVEKLIDIYSNVVPVPSASGKVCKEHIAKYVWYEECFLPILNGKFFNSFF